ncbi:MAG: HDOD domain-containing protein [Anaeromusa sp.]|uniref:EAL and HDOD domain-containing protein n=1 Tax=Anaeromusa sp. TaxID=1872520 RepID=UPI002B21AB4C|nr:HDOD domain-containing protein [Anaeromusa sp.]MEA4835718.1 HDOD domain-containing protein [Anaeromusa sp.]
MELFIARQPIFDTQKNVVAYELLFRSAGAATATHTDDTAATRDVLSNAFLMMGIDSLTDGQRAFVNFGTATLLDQVPQLLPANILTVEILETVEPTQEVINACALLKKAGYTLALDDFEPDKAQIPLILLADIIKVDFRSPKSMQGRQFAERLCPGRIRYLAEKVETESEFRQALNEGYSFFQGYFFSRPAILTQKSIPVNHLHYLQLLNHLYTADFDVDQIEQLIKRDLSLSLQFLKYINSAFFGFRVPVQSIRHAAALLGQQGLAKWISLVALRNLAQEHPPELLRTAVVRARFSELLIQHRPHPVIPQDHFFLVGLFSLLEAFLQKPLEDILEKLPLARSIKDALAGHPNPLRQVLDLVIAYEQGNWEQVLAVGEAVQLPHDAIVNAYFDALLWEKEFIVLTEV